MLTTINVRHGPVAEGNIAGLGTSRVFFDSERWFRRFCRGKLIRDVTLYCVLAAPWDLRGWRFIFQQFAAQNDGERITKICVFNHYLLRSLHYQRLGHGTSSSPNNNINRFYDVKKKLRRVFGL